MNVAEMSDGEANKGNNSLHIDHYEFPLAIRIISSR